MAYTDDLGIEHHPEFKKNLAKHVAEVLEGIGEDDTRVRELTDILNGRDDGASWDVTNVEVDAALAKLVKIEMLYLKDDHTDPGHRVYAMLPDYAAMLDRGEQIDIDLELEAIS